MNKLKLSVLIIGLLFFSLQSSSCAETITNSSPLITHTLIFGSSGSEVGTLQNILQKLGYFTYPAITGYFGNVTKAAVVAFQKANGIDPIGVVGPMTRAKLLFLYNNLEVNLLSTTTPIVVKPIGFVHSGRIIYKDDIAPPAPTNLDSNSVSQTSLVLTWTLSTDKSGILNYLIERCEGDGCADFVEINSQSNSSYNDSGLTADILYRYRIRAVDTVGNISSYSSVYDVETLPIPTNTITVSKSGTGDGQVTSVPAGVSCGSTCMNSFSTGTIVTLTATPSVGSAFIGWSGACSGTAECVIDLQSDVSVTAVFNISSFTLTVHKIGLGDGNILSTPAGIACGATCTANYESGTMVTLTAVPVGSYIFAGWSGACSGSGICTVTMDAAKSVTASFISLMDA